MATTLQEDQMPWYRQFWPLFIIALPVTVIIACIFLIVLSIRTADDIVSKDYYQEGLDINTVLSKMDNARQQGIQFSATLENRQINATLTIAANAPETLTLKLSDTMNRDKDATILLQRQPDSSYRGTLPDSINNGRFYADLSPQSGADWLIKSVIFLPDTHIHLSP